jgi:opacity protein-like surface antigen
MKSLLLAAVAAFALSGAAQASVVTIDFDAMTSGSPVGAFYSGVGVTMSGLTVSNGPGATSQPHLAFLDRNPVGIDTTFGFTAFSFTSGFFMPGTVEVYSGAGGTGTLLGSLSGLLGNPFAFSPFSIPLSGVAHSVVITGTPGTLGFDDLRFTTGVPEPATWALMIGGFGLAGAALRRRRPAAIAA